MRESWTIPVDQHGLVIYFGVRGRPFFFNGHKGVFYDSLPPDAVEALDALSTPEENARILAGLPRRNHRVGRNGLGKEIQLYRRGTHPDLEPEARQAGFCRRLDPQEIVVYVSRACNLACTYCFNQGGTFGTRGSLMSAETAKDSVAFIRAMLATSTRRYVTVNLFGGEPLLARPALYTLVRGLQDVNRSGLATKVHILLSTNGTIYDQQIFDVLAEEPECNTVVVTLDAFKEAQDKNRPFRGRRASSYDTVIANLRRMIDKKIPYSVSCQVPFPYDYIAAAEELHRLGFEWLEIRLMIRHVFGKQELPDVFQDDLALWKEKYLAYCDYYLDYLKTPRPAKHSDRRAVLGDYAKGLDRAGGSPHNLGCGIIEDLISIAADGRAIPCHCFLHEGFELGHVKTGIDAAQYDRFEKWILSQGQLRIDNERCRNCYAKLLCGGGCYAASYDRAHRLEPLPESSCQFAREKVKIDLYFISRMRKEHPELLKAAP